MKGFEEWEKLSNITFQIVPHKVNLGFNIFSDTLVREDIQEDIACLNRSALVHLKACFNHCAEGNNLFLDKNILDQKVAEALI